jgi:hypothetical protein
MASPPPPAPDPHLDKYSDGSNWTQAIESFIEADYNTVNAGEAVLAEELTILFFSSPASDPTVNPEAAKTSAPAGCECESATGGWTLGTCQVGQQPGPSFPVFLGVKLGPFSLSLTCSFGRTTSSSAPLVRS